MLDYKETKIVSMKRQLKILDAHLVQNDLEEAEKESHELKKNIYDMITNNIVYEDQIVLLEAQVQVMKERKGETSQSHQNLDVLVGRVELMMVLKDIDKLQILFSSWQQGLEKKEEELESMKI